MSDDGEDLSSVVEQQRENGAVNVTPLHAVSRVVHEVECTCMGVDGNSR